MPGLTLPPLLRAIKPDRFIMALIGTVILASVLPCRGIWRVVFSDLTIAAIAIMFFLQGARLPTRSVVAGLAHWRLHLAILGATFVFFPVAGLLLRALFPNVLPTPLWLGELFVCALPSTVQSSIAFTSIARGNVAAAVVAATASNLLGIVVTPVLTGILLARHGGISLDSVRDIALQLLLPFVAGQLLQKLIGAWAVRRKAWLSITDRGSIILVVYTAFSAAVAGGIWQLVGVRDLAALAAVNAVVLAAVLSVTWFGARSAGFSREDAIAILFCGSKKSLATGVPMARVLFAGPGVGLAVLPVMLFHQMQLMACAVIARRLAGGEEERPAASP